MLLSHAHGYSGPVHDEISVGGREVSAGHGRNFVTSSQLHAIANSPPLLGDTPAAFQIDPYAFRPPSVTEGRALQDSLTHDDGIRRRSRGRPSTVGSGQRTRTSLGGNGVRMHGGGLVEAEKLPRPRPRQEGPDIRFQVNTRLSGSRAAFSGEYTPQGGSPDGSHRVVESFRGSPVRLAPVADVQTTRRQQNQALAHDQGTVQRLESPEPPQLGTLPRMYQVQERVKFYMCELVKDPTGRSLREMYAEILGLAGRDVRDKESLPFIEMAKLLAMNDLGQMYHGGRHQGDVPLPPYPTSGNVSKLMHRDREKEMLKHREALDAISAAEATGNLEAAEAMRSRLEEEQQQKTANEDSIAVVDRAIEPEPEPNELTSTGLSKVFSRGNLIRALAEKSASLEGSSENTTAESVHKIAQTHALTSGLFSVIQQFTDLGCSVDELLAFAKNENMHGSTAPAEDTRTGQEVLQELAEVVKTTVVGLLKAARGFCEASVCLAVRGSGAAQKGSDCVSTMWELLEALSAKAAVADDVGAAVAARADIPCLNAVELVQTAMSTLAEVDQLWNDVIQLDVPQGPKNPWVDGLEALLQAMIQSSKKHEQAMRARAQAELLHEKAEVKRLQAQIENLEYQIRLAKADKEAAAVATSARDAEVRAWTGAVMIDSVCALGGEMVAARKRAWTSEDATEGHRWSASKLCAAVEKLQQLSAPLGGEEKAQQEDEAAAGQQGADKKSAPTAPQPVNEWMASLTDTMKVLLNASTMCMREMVAQYSLMREDVVRFE